GGVHGGLSAGRTGNPAIRGRYCQQRQASAATTHRPSTTPHNGDLISALRVRGMIADFHHRRAPPRMRVSRQIRVIARIVLILIAVSLVGGCSLFGKKKADPLEVGTVEQLYERGKTANERGDYDVAVKTFTRLVARFPFGPYTEQAQLDQAYAQYKMNKPDD